MLQKPKQLKKIVIATGPLTGIIHASNTSNPGLHGSDKVDVTMECLIAVVEHIKHLGESVVIGKKVEGEFVGDYTISIEKH